MCRLVLTRCPDRAIGNSRFARAGACWAALFFILICGQFIAGCATGDVHRRTGTLLVRSPLSPTVAIDFGEDDSFGVVVARVVANSRLQRGERPIGLLDFQMGEEVTVTWRVTPEGTDILTMLAKENSSSAPIPGMSKKEYPLPHEKRELGALIGESRRHLVAKNDTLLDIARWYGLGFNEIVEPYPQYDPWLPPVGKELAIPSQWLLPDAGYAGIVINIPEMRLFAFSRRNGKPVVRTFPIGIGDVDVPTVAGTYRIGAKRTHPTWYIPPSLQAKYQRTTFPPGPDNPLGDYWIGLAGTLYGIHGTDIPWSVGRLVTHGCIRMYPEDIAEFYPSATKGLRVQMVYQPVKVALISGRVYIEVHRDVYSRVGNLTVHGQSIIVRKKLRHLVDQNKFIRAVALQSGVVTDITATLPD